MIKVSKFQKQIFLFSFEPKKEQDYFFYLTHFRSLGQKSKNLFRFWFKWEQENLLLKFTDLYWQSSSGGSNIFVLFMKNWKVVISSFIAVFRPLCNAVMHLSTKPFTLLGFWDKKHIFLIAAAYKVCMEVLYFVYFLINWKIDIGFVQKK